jgi:DNA-3-methyladenine glycosylase I
MTSATIPAGIVVGGDGRRRCWWAGDEPLYMAYHDEEWGRPVADERRLFEVISLEAFQSGLSWLTILRKRASFRDAFAGWDIERIAGFGRADVDRLLADASIVRNRAKIRATIGNARRYADVVARFGSLAALVWGLEPPPQARPRDLDHESLLAMPTAIQSRPLSQALRGCGWVFVGPTTAYSVMEAVGVVNDHLEGCAVRLEVERERAAFTRPAPIVVKG